MEPTEEEKEMPKGCAGEAGVDSMVVRGSKTDKGDEKWNHSQVCAAEELIEKTWNMEIGIRQ